jgi:hypothetical protein
MPGLPRRGILTGCVSGERDLEGERKCQRDHAGPSALAVIRVPERLSFPLCSDFRMTLQPQSCRPSRPLSWTTKCVTYAATDNC